MNDENTNGFLSRLEKTTLIIKNKNRKSGLNTWADVQGAVSSDCSYISTPYFERSYTLTDDIENYLNKYIK